MGKYVVLLGLLAGLALLAPMSAQAQALEKEPSSLRINAWTGYVAPFRQEAERRLQVAGLNWVLAPTPASGPDRFRQLLKAGATDLVTPAHDLIPVLAREGLIQPIPPDCAPNARKLNPLILQKLPKAVLSHALPFTYGPYALAYNTETMAQPESYRVLWDPRHRGRISISTYDTANIYMVALMLGFPVEQLFNLNDEQLAAITAELKQLRTQQQPTYWDDNLDPNDAQQLDVALDWSVGVQQINALGGPRWDMVVPREGATAWVDSWAIGAHVKGEALRAACIIIDVALSQQAQAAVARATGYAVVNMYAGRELSPAEVVSFHLTDPDYLNRLIMWQPLDDNTMARYRRAWEASAPGDAP